MINSFDKENSMLQAIIHIGGIDYDLQDLIDRLISAEADIYRLKNRVSVLEQRLNQSEDKVIIKSDFLNLRTRVDNLEHITRNIQNTYGRL